MQVLQTNQFKKLVKKLHPNVKKELDVAIKTVLNDPLIGENKVGDLRGVYVYKFRLHKELVLLAYTFTKTELTLLSFGPHENFYRDLKKSH